MFHSFSQFNIGNGLSAYFLVQPEIRSIFARVTGADPSNILGRLGTRINDAALSPSTASLFLLNPNGIVFGPNAKLDVAGSFLGATASALKFANGEFFSAVNPQAPLLMISVPVGLQMGQQVGDVKFNGTFLIGGTSQTLGFIGGDVQVSEAFLAGDSGRLDIGAVGEGAFVGLTSNVGGWAIDYSGVSRFRDIVVDQSFISNNSDLGGAGNIFLNAGKLTVKNGAVIITTRQDVEAQSNITINARNGLTVQSAPSQISFIGTVNDSQGGSSGSNVNISTPALSLLDGASILTVLSGQGKAGDVNVNSSEAITIAGSQISDTSVDISTIGSGITGDGVGQTGNINLKSKNINLLEGGVIRLTNDNKGVTGEVNLKAEENIVISGATPIGNNSSITNRQQGIFDNGGSTSNLPPGINLRATNLILQGGGSISTSNFSAGDVRNIAINVSGDVIVKGGLASPSSRSFGIDPSTGSLLTQLNFLSSGISTSKTGNPGNSGDILINAKSVKVLEGGSISSEISQAAYFTFNQPLPSIDIFQGRSGNIEINASDLVLLEGQSFQPALLSLGGYFKSNITNRVNIGSNAQGGKIVIKTRDLQIKSGASIDSEMTGSKGRGGDIEVFSSGNILVDGEGRSLIGPAIFEALSNIGTTTVTPFLGNAGNIKLDANSLTVSNGGAVTSGTRGGGKVEIFQSELMTM
ncbi:MAG: filamentous hemagglutinin N-terminal domain-containing protein [Alkalinema sp. RU_4_3]|nr:filamentous hemagglutinin N-terminal domain-containing protein [Alkalinema sp. RU_4_3]